MERAALPRRLSWQLGTVVELVEETAQTFDTELTTATGACATCRRRSPVAEFGVCLRNPGTVVRCRHRASVVMVIVEAHGVSRVDLRGLEALEGAG